MAVTKSAPDGIPWGSGQPTPMIRSIGTPTSNPVNSTAEAKPRAIAPRGSSFRFIGNLLCLFPVWRGHWRSQPPDVFQCRARRALEEAGSTTRLWRPCRLGLRSTTRCARRETRTPRSELELDQRSGFLPLDIGIRLKSPERRPWLPPKPMRRQLFWRSGSGLRHRPVLRA